MAALPDNFTVEVIFQGDSIELQEKFYEVSLEETINLSYPNATLYLDTAYTIPLSNYSSWMDLYNAGYLIDHGTTMFDLSIFVKINVMKYLDQEGVKYLWSKISMEDYPNNETLMAVINAIDETKASNSEVIKHVAQTLVEEQKIQARQNIDVLSADEINNLLEVDYDNSFAFDTSEIVIDASSSVLGQGMLGHMILG